MAEITIQTGPAAATPTVGNVRIYSKTDNKIYSKDSSGVETTLSPPPSATSAKAWVRFNGATAVISSSYNVSSVTRNAQGDYTIAFSSSLADANYALVGSHSSTSAGISSFVSNYMTAPTTSSCRVGTFVQGSATDPTYVSVIIFGT